MSVIKILLKYNKMHFVILCPFNIHVRAKRDEFAYKGAADFMMN